MLLSVALGCLWGSSLCTCLLGGLPCRHCTCGCTWELLSRDGSVLLSVALGCLWGSSMCTCRLGGLPCRHCTRGCTWELLSRDGSVLLSVALGCLWGSSLCTCLLGGLPCRHCTCGCTCSGGMCSLSCSTSCRLPAWVVVWSGLGLGAVLLPREGNQDRFNCF